MATRESEGALAASPRPAGGRSWRDGIAPAAVGAVLLIAYLRTMARIAVPEDSAELVTTVHRLGIPHPPGYPLFAMVGKLWDLAIPIGTVAFRFNLLAALMGVAAGVVVAWAYRASGGARPASALAGLAAGLFSDTWAQSLSYEVYSMHLLLSALALVAFVRWRRRPTPRRLVMLAGLAGLTMSHHVTGWWVALPLAVAALALHRPLGWRLLLKCVGAGLLPFLAYLYLPIDSLRDPYVRWGDASTWQAFKEHVTGQMFRAYLGSHGAERMEPLELLRWLVRQVGTQLTVGADARAPLSWAAWGVAWGLLAVGWGAWWRRERAAWACTTAAVVLSVLWVSFYRVMDQPVFLVACFSIFGLWLAAGAETIAGWAGRVFQGRGWVMAAFAVLVPLKLIITNWAPVNLNSRTNVNQWVVDYTRLVLHAAKPNAILVLRGHAWHSEALYLQQCEGARPDVSIVSSGLASYPWYITKHTNPIVVQGIEDALPALKRIPDPQYWQFNWCPYLATAIARVALPGTPVYVNQRFEPPLGFVLLDGPPIEEMVRQAPDLTAPDAAGAKTALEFPVGLALLGAKIEPASVPRGGFFSVRLDWRCSRAIDRPVTVQLFFVLEGAERLLSPNAAEFLITGDESLLAGDQRDAARRIGFGERHLLLYGLLPLQANAPQRHYERSVPFVAPSGLTPGRYRGYLSVGLEGRPEGSLPIGEITILPRREG